MGNECRRRFSDYSLIIDWPTPFDPEEDVLDVILKAPEGEEYWANFTTLEFLKHIFQKNKETGELLSGTYFAIPGNMVIVRRLTEKNIRKTVEHLIENGEVEDYFKNPD